MIEYINPLSDFGFKHLFGNEHSKEMLISFLNDLLNLDYKIVDLTFKNVEIQGQTHIDRKALFDIYCTDSNNTNFIVELQKANQKYLRDRMLYYASTAIVEQAKKGSEWEYQLQKLYSIAIANFTIFDDKEYLRSASMRDDESYEIIQDKLKLVFLEIPKFKKKSNELESHLDKWLYFIKNLNKDESIYDLFKDDPTIQKSIEIAKVTNLNPIDYETYKASLKELNDRYAEVEMAKYQGELKKSIDIARKMIENKESIDKVILYSDLTLEQLKEYKLI